MTALQAVLLGVVQGLTEFLPVSSDGHLAIVYQISGKTPDLAFEVFLHLATLLATIVYFRHDLWVLLRAFLLPVGKGTPERRLAWLVAAATLLSGLLALAIKPLVEEANASLVAIAGGFLFTSAAMVAGELLSRRARSREREDLTPVQVAVIAVAQALAALPGVSRSASTISTGISLGLSREQAARFSFVLGVPIIVLANVYEGIGVVRGAAAMPGIGVSLVGFAAAAVAGYLAIAGLLALVRRHALYVFSVYTACVGTAVLIWAVVAR